MWDKQDTEGTAKAVLGKNRKARKARRQGNVGLITSRGSASGNPYEWLKWERWRCYAVANAFRSEPVNHERTPRSQFRPLCVEQRYQHAKGKSRCQSDRHNGLEIA